MGLGVDVCLSPLLQMDPQQLTSFTVICPSSQDAALNSSI